MVNQNLLKITQTPANMQISINDGTLTNRNDPEPLINVQTGEGGYRIETTPAKINVDTYAARSSMGYGEYNSMDFHKVEVQKAKQRGSDAIRKIVNDGNAMARGTKAPQIAMQALKAKTHIATETTFFPEGGADVSFQEGGVELDYKMKEVNIDWQNLEVSKLKFTRGSVDINIIDKGGVEIEYTGKPLYVPLSANPDYDPPETVMNTKG